MKYNFLVPHSYLIPPMCIIFHLRVVVFAQVVGPNIGVDHMKTWQEDIIERICEKVRYFFSEVWRWCYSVMHT